MVKTHQTVKQKQNVIAWVDLPENGKQPEDGQKENGQQMDQPRLSVEGNIVGKLQNLIVRKLNSPHENLLQKHTATFLLYNCILLYYS